VTNDVQALTRFAGTMLADPDARRQMGDRARAAAKASGNLAVDTARTLMELMAHE
jgi:hypothetical protein